MDINSVKKIGSPGQNVVIETAGKIYVKVQDRFYELDFKNLGKSTQNTITNIVNNNSTPTDLSKYVSKDYLKSALSQYVTTKTWQSVKATQYALQNSGLPGFSESINPITIDTMQLLVGAEQLQYDFVNHLGYYAENPDTKMPTLGGLSTIIYNDPTFSDSIRLVCNPGIIKHYVYNGPEAVQAGMQDFQYCRWIVSEAINQDSLSDDNIWAIKHYDFNSDLDWKSQITLPTLNPFIVDLPINDKIYYLYIQAYYMDSNMTRELEWPTITGDSEIAAWLHEYYNIESDSPIIMPISFTFSQVVSLYDSLLGQKKRMIKEDEDNFVINWANEWDNWENCLIKYLYEFKVGTARYVLTETPLGEYEYVYDEEARQYTDEILAYNFLYAIVGNNGSSGRSITTLNGFTEITPGQVTAYIFKTPDGQQYINFKDGTLHIGNPYEDKKGEWMHYSPDGGLEISGKLTVTGGGLQKELEYLDKLASGEFEIYYSDDALKGPTGQNAYYGANYLPAWGMAPSSSGDEDESGDDSGDVGGETEGGNNTSVSSKSYNQYIPFPNDSKKSTDSSWYERINWPAADWNSVKEKESHLGDLYVVSRNIPWNNGTDKIEDDKDPNYAYDTDNTSYNEAKLIFRYIKTEEPTGENGKNQDTYYWTVAESNLLSTLITNFDDYGYLKKALNNSTTIAGGLILTSAIGLGYSDIEDEQASKDSAHWTLTAGLSGIVSDDIYKTDIAAWYGGGMDDPIQYLNKNKPSGSSQGHINQNYKAPDSSGGVSYPQTLFRHDGSGYIGGLKNNIPAIQWDSETLAIRDDINVVDSNGNTISTLGALNDFFEKVYIQNGNLYTPDDNYLGWNSNSDYDTVVRVKPKYKGLYSGGFISAYGYSSTGGGTGSDATSIYGKSIVLTNLSDGDALIYSTDDGGKWINGPAGIAAIDSPTVGDILRWSSSGAEWIDPLDNNFKVAHASIADSLAQTVKLWGNNFNGTQSISEDIYFGYVNNNNFTNKISTTSWGTLPTNNNTLYVYGNIVASGFISAYGESSSGSSSGGDASSIAGKLVIEPSDWTGLDGKSLVYDASENDGEGAWIIGNADIQWPSGANTGYLLGWDSGNAEWVNPLGNNFVVKKAQYLSNEPSLWGHTFNGYDSITGDLSYVGNIYFGGNSSSNTIKLSTTAFSGTTQANTLYVTGNIVASGYISAYGTSSSGGSSSGDASSIGGKDINISSLSDGQILMYDVLDDEWKNVDPDVIPIITLNGSGTTSASFYAPITWGSSTQVLVGDGSGNAPIWTNISSLSVSNSNYANTAGELNNTYYLWGNAFKGNNDIGTSSSPASLYHVGDIELVNGRSLYIDKYPAGDGALQILTMANDNQLVIGYGLLHGASSSAQYNTYIDGYTVHLRTSKNGDSHVDSVVIEHNGSTSFKNDIGVNGSITSTGGASIGGGLTVGGGATISGILNANSSANIGYNLVVGSSNASGYGNLTVKGDYIYIKNSLYYLKYEANSGNPYLHTNLPIVSDGFITAYGVSSTTPVVPEDGGSEDGGGTEDSGKNSEW